APGAHAAYITDIPSTLQQPDGTTLKVLLSGDEYYNYAHDARGYVIIQRPDGWWTYAKRDGDDVVPTEFIVSKVDPALAGLTPRVLPSPKTLYAKRAAYRAAAPVLASAPKTGTLNNIVVFIRFSDQTEFPETFASYDSTFNGGAGKYSLKNYYNEVSYGKLNISSTLLPTPTGTTVLSYKDPNPRAYYMPYNAAANPLGYTSSNSAAREHSLLANAMAAVSSQIPKTLVVDGDNDGFMDNVCFVARGDTGAWSDLLWPHAWALYLQEVRVNGARLWNYNLQIENHLKDSGCSVLAHEMFHTLGAPDLYHYTSSPIDPLSTWDLMAANTAHPQHMSAYMKYRYARWISIIPEIVASGTYTLNPLQSSAGNCLKIKSPNSATEYFVVEYRRKPTAGFDSMIPGSGLVIYRINSARDGSGNASGPPDEVYVYRPGGTCADNGTPDTAFCNSSVGRTVFNATSNPACFLSTCGTGGIAISEVGLAGATIKFRVDIPAKPFTMAEAQEAVLVASGLTSASMLRFPRLNVVPDSGVDMLDATVILRKAVGVDPNP
ncbi:MAG TPA: M6 family metalloprotease domain-containing protein, partial [Armatimonadota bacterium]